MKLRIALIISMTSMSLLIFAQSNCTKIITGTYSGSTVNGSFDKYGSTNVAIDTLNNGKVTISDFSAGFFSEFGKNGIPVTMDLDCNANIVPIDLETEWGMAAISGTYTPVDTKLTVNWSIPHNNLNETSIFILSSNE